MLLIDSMMLVYRCAAKMDFLMNDAGEPTGMEFGFLRTVQMLSRKYPKHDAVLCWESGGAAKRRGVDARYKASRKPMEQALRDRVTALRQFCRGFYFDAEAPGYEADDAMYSLSQDGYAHLVYTNDDDLLQAISDKHGVRVLKSFKSQLFEWDEAKVREKYGISPQDLPLYRAFVGDGSDELPGAPRIDKRYLAALVNWCRDAAGDYRVDWALREICEAKWGPQPENVRAHVDSGQARRNYDLMRLNPVHVDVREPALDRDAAVAQLKRWQIRTLDLCAQFHSELAPGSEEEF